MFAGIPLLRLDPGHSVLATPARAVGGTSRPRQLPCLPALSCLLRVLHVVKRALG